MPEDVQIKQFELSDQAALLSFLRSAYPDDVRASDAAFWRWHFLENPYVSPGDIPIWIVKSGERIVGQAATIPVELKVGGETRRAIWVVDFVVDTDHQGRGLGKRLVLAARDHCPTMFAMGPNEQSGAVFHKLEWVMTGGTHRYQRLLFAGNALKEITSVGPLRSLANFFYAPSRSRLTRLSSAQSGSVREVTTFDDSFDDLWQRANPQWLCAVVRSSRLLEWQFMRQPGKKFEVLGLYDSDRLLGYVVLFFRKPERRGVSPKAAITDLCYDAHSSDEVIDDLLRAALYLTLARRAGSLVIDILDSRVEARLSHYGFWGIRKAPRLMVFAPDRQDLLYEPGNWYLTRADADVSIFERPNV